MFVYVVFILFHVFFINSCETNARVNSIQQSLYLFHSFIHIYAPISHHHLVDIHQTHQLGCFSGQLEMQYFVIVFLTTLFVDHGFLYVLFIENHKCLSIRFVNHVGQKLRRYKVY